MNKNAIKKFAIDARKKLIASVTDRAGMLGITPEGCSEPISKGIDFEVYKTVAGTEVTLGRTQCEQRRKLKEQIEARGFEAVVEEVAYTWFNRICAIRFMEVNDYLPARVRVLSSEKEGKNEPDIVTQAPDVDLDFTDKEREYILDCKMNNKLDELFKMLFIKQCNKLSEILPELFEATEDYTEMLLNISYTNKDDIVNMLVNQETGIPEADFNVSIIGEDGQPTGQVEIIGWLYQYYNTELKDDTFAQLKKNVKISKERIPAATQLFTPDWIVRYMVENSVGRLWIEHLRAVDPAVNEKEVAERFGWKYYLPEAEQEADVNMKLAEIRTSYKDLKPEDITCIDPCMGSGHILVAMFDVLMDIYKSAGYSEREAAFEIVEHNIHGLDIDKRAYQLAYFAVMMKGRGYNRRFLKGKEDRNILPKIYVVQESNRIASNHYAVMDEVARKENVQHVRDELMEILEQFKDAKACGSMLQVKKYDWRELRRFVEKLSIKGQYTFESIGIEYTQSLILKIIDIAEVLSNTYMAIVTNPPYMSNRGMSGKTLNYVQKYYKDSKSDLFAVFVDVVSRMTAECGIYAMITQPSILSLSTFAKLRMRMIRESNFLSLLHMGRGIFGVDFGSTAFVIRNVNVKKYNGIYFKLHKRTFQYIEPQDIRNIFLSAKSDPDFVYDFDSYNCDNIIENDNVEQNETEEINEEGILYYIKQEEFLRIPDNPFAYWMPKKVIDLFDNDRVEDFATVTNGLFTCDNNRFLRFWFEVAQDNIFFNCNSKDESNSDERVWYPYNKGGNYRKWYGNHEYVVNFKHFGKEISQYRVESGQSASFPGQDYYFCESLSWSFISAAKFGIRYYPKGFVFDIAGSSVFPKNKNELYSMLAFLGSELSTYVLQILNPTMNYQAGNVRQLPIEKQLLQNDELSRLARENVLISKEDWDSFETSWEFKKSPLIGIGQSMEQAQDMWSQITQERFEKVKQNEIRINEIISEYFSLDGLVECDVDDKYITIYKADREKDIRDFISYAVGCMFGRYNIEKNGVQSIGQTVALDGNSFIDLDNCIPITDEEYFQDDIVNKFIEFVKIVYGDDNLEANLEFIATALGTKGKTAREVIRNYFIKDFYSEHIKRYQKRPIYWLFDSGKQNGFKCLIYIHRYDNDLVGRIRVEYLHKMQNYLENALKRAEYLMQNTLSTSEKANAKRAIDKYSKQIAEIASYDEAIAHVANQRIGLDLDDGVKANYEKFQGVEVAQEGKKALKIDLLAKIK